MKAFPLLFLCLVSCVGMVSGTNEQPMDAATVVPDAGMSPVDAGETEDAGMPQDAGATVVEDAGVDAGPPRCPADFCEDFEASDGGSTFGLFDLLGTDDAGIELLPPPPGNTSGHAVRVSMERGRGTLQLKHELFAADAGYHFFGRVKLYGERMPGDAENVRHGWVTLEGKSPTHGSYSQLGFRHDSGRKPFGNFFVLTPWQDCWANALPAVTAMPRQQWVCYEFEYDARTRTQRLWVDGVQQLDVVGLGSGCTDGNATRPWEFPTEVALGIGVYSYDAYPYVGWVDDVALSSTGRIGCE